MRKIVSFNSKWAFTKQCTEIPERMPDNWYIVNLPHTWNAIDGQDGGNDYYRGTGLYAKSFKRAELPESERYYLEICGANSSADVYLNGCHLAHHDGGYSAWRVDITDALEDDDLLVIAVDNSASSAVYPQMADFTFYGGLYRDVNVICVGESHFDLDYFGSPGIAVTPTVKGADGEIKAEVWVTNMKPTQSLRYTILSADNAEIASHVSTDTEYTSYIKDVHLWHGRRDPYLYTMRVELLDGENVLDTVTSRFGCRSYSVDPERGFILNGEEYPLRGVSRHQDRWGIGNALLPEHHREDIELIYELGATTIRLAHYQHDRYFYELCDEKGFVVWAEIPYISQHMPSARENTISQMRELIVQSYNHPSIVVWGLSNEITMRGDADPDLLENHRILNDLCHTLDRTRLTTVAALSPCPPDSPYLRISDLVSYNHYFGWYGGDTDMNGPWFDDFHKRFPNIPIGCSEYGCEALNWHSSTPTQGDYTEEYQAYYHEELIKQLFSRKYLWATHVWNMFDFGADARNEGGENGQNHKGLVTFDRKYKKDAFYAYKAWLSDEPFVHLCGKRYIDRVEDVTRVTVYSNQPTVELFANGISLGKKSASDHFFRFDVPNAGETKLVAVAGALLDESSIRKAAVFNDAYRMVEKNAVLNWFDITERDGYFSLNDKVGDILATEDGKKLLSPMLSGSMVSGGEHKPDDTMMRMLAGFTVLRLSGMLSVMGVELTKEQLLDMNAQLNTIKK